MHYDPKMISALAIVQERDQDLAAYLFNEYWAKSTIIPNIKLSTGFELSFDYLNALKQEYNTNNGYGGGPDKVAAIKRCRELTGFGLREAKDVVDELCNRNML